VAGRDQRVKLKKTHANRKKKNTNKLIKHLLQFYNTHVLQILTTQANTCINTLQIEQNTKKMFPGDPNK